MTTIKDDEWIDATFWGTSCLFCGLSLSTWHVPTASVVIKHKIKCKAIVESGRQGSLKNKAAIGNAHKQLTFCQTCCAEEAVKDKKVCSKSAFLCTNAYTKNIFGADMGISVNILGS